MTIRAEMQALMDLWVARFESRDLDGAVALYSDDAVIHSPFGPHAVGRNAVRATFADWMAAGEVNKRVTVEEAGGEGAQAWFLASDAGDYPTPEGGFENDTGVSLNVAQRDERGQWLLRATSLNSDTPPLAGN